MTSFFLLFDEWEIAATAAARASARVCRQLDDYCEGRGAPPSPADIAESRRLVAEANHRLVALRSHLHEQRGRVALI